MNSQSSAKKDVYYTKDHEWIDFQGSVAYVGMCKIKLTGFKQIAEVRFTESSGFKKQGEVIASVSYKDYLIEAHMPVDGKVLKINDTLSVNPNDLLEYPESSAWIALIIPSQPHERSGLLLHKQHQMKGKSKYQK